MLEPYWLMVGPIIGTAIGLGFLLFIHEFGHFFVAKRAGVKVEVFSLGIAHFIFSWTWNGTVYALSWLPLGGYVRMAGQQDLAPPPDHKPEPWEYGAKRPIVRMAIIAAGVTMNFIGGWLCFSAAYMVGRDVQPPVVGKLDVGSVEQAREFNAGLTPGRRIVSVEGDRVYTRDAMEMRVARITPGTEIRLGLVEKGEDPDDPKNIKYVKVKTLKRMKGISTLAMFLDKAKPRQNIEVQAGFTAEPRMIVTSMPQGLAKLPEWKQLFQPADVIETANGEICLSEGDFRKVLEQCEGKAIEVEVTGADGLRRKVKLPVSAHYVVGIEFVTTGDVLKVGKVLKGSPAMRAGIKKGDAIRLGAAGNKCDFFEFREAVQNAVGKPLLITVTNSEGKSRQESLSAQFKAWYPDPGQLRKYDGLPWGDSQIVRKVDPGSMAEAKGLKEGAVLLDIEMRSEPDPIYISWAYKGERYGPHQLNKLEGGSTMIWIRPLREELSLDVGVSLKAGWNETLETLLSTTVILKKVMNREVSATRTLSGPISIVRVAYYSAQKGLGRMLWLLGLIGVSLAFFNLLPIPVLDGGHLAFLGYEVVVRKPPPPRLVEMGQYAGLLVILCLFVFVFWNDISNMIGG
jgi:regulator of sigma E protease